MPLTTDDFETIQRIFEHTLRTHGMINGELIPLEEQARTAAGTLVREARLALGILLQYPVTRELWDQTSATHAQRVAINLQGVIEQFEKEFKL